LTLLGIGIIPFDIREGRDSCLRAKRGVIGVFVLVLIVVGLLVPAGKCAAAPKVYIVPLQGQIEHGLASFIARGLREASDAGADVVIIDIDTPGGYVDSALKMRDAIISSEVRTIAYVDSRAWSAGALIAIACDDIAMKMGSSMGAAETRPKEEKYISAVRAEFEATAELRGRDPAVAGAMVDADVEIPGVIERGKILTLTATAAENLGFIEYKVKDLDDLLELLGLSGAEIVDVKQTSAEWFARLLTNQVAAEVLLTLGLVGLAVELVTPGFGIPGTIGIVSLGLFFGGRIMAGLCDADCVLCDGAGASGEGDAPRVCVSARTGRGKEELLGAISRLAQSVGGLGEGPPIVGDLVSCGDIVVLVIPADAQAPKGRLILPQVQTIRDVLDHEGIAVAVRIDQLRQLFADKDFLPRLVVTDSQAFGEVAPVVPESVPMTSFSILFARHKGDFELLVEGARAIEGLEPGDVVLISEACTHHPIEDDIGTVKIPRLLNAKVGGELRYEWQRGGDFPEDLDRFKLVINCGGCMLNRREMCSRLEAVADAAVPVTNYGMAIAACLGILPRALRPFAL
jgi:hypothetical protein